MRRLLWIAPFVLAALLGAWIGVGTVDSAQPTPPTPTPVPPCEYEGSSYNYDVTIRPIMSPGQTGTILRVSGTSADSCLPQYLRYEAVVGGITIVANETSCGNDA